MARRTKDEIKRDAITVQECTKRISGDVLSFGDLAEKLNLTEKQLRYTFDCMEEETSERIKSRLKFLSQRANELKNYKTLRFSTKTMLGFNGKRTKGIFIDPSTLNQVLEEGALVPRKNDIIYVVEHYDEKIFFRKALVLSVEVRHNSLKVAVLELIKERFPESRSISEIALNCSIFDGIDSYVLSKI